MIKTEKILDAQPYFLVCQFNNGEIKKLNVEAIFKDNVNSISANKILKEDFFVTAKIGEMGQILWDNAAEMKDENGNLFLCEYDISAEYAYYNSNII